MPREISIFRINGWSKNINNPKGLIIFNPGLFDDIKKSSFWTIFNSPVEFDIFSYNIYTIANPKNINKSLTNFVDDLNTIVKEFCKTYKNIFIISYSFSSEIVLRSTFPFEVKALALWSPSFFYPQNITCTLAPLDHNKDILTLGSNIISKKIAKELDSLDTITVISRLNKPVQIYTAIGEDGEKSWSNPEVFKLIGSKEKIQIKLPFQHQYQEKEIEDLFLKTCEWFNKFTK